MTRRSIRPASRHRIRPRHASSSRIHARKFGATRANPDRRKEIAAEREAAQQKQIDEIVALIGDHQPRIDSARAVGAKYRIAVLGRARKSLVPIAAALREAGIPFRAVELEKLKHRPEIIDALALARALSSIRRIASRGLAFCALPGAAFRSPICTRSQRRRSPELLAWPVPQLLSDTRNSLSDEGRQAVERVLRAIEFAGRLRSAQPSATLGTWLEQVWLHLGGAQCVDAAARANLDLLWSCLDNLPQGEPDLLGSALDAALEKLTAMPDPAAASDCGVQLMTIHKSKGLEFEVVIVPDLQAGPGRGKPEMLSWLERGLPPDADVSEPASPRNHRISRRAVCKRRAAERGAGEKVGRPRRRDREKQETRRLLYVAATRAREELHLFARPSYKTESTARLEPRRASRKPAQNCLARI